MHNLWVILLCLAATFAFAFLLAGVSVLALQGLQDIEPPRTRKEEWIRLVDSVLLGGLVTLFTGFRSNRTAEREARAMIYAGLVSLAVTVLLGYLVCHSA